MPKTKRPVKQPAPRLRKLSLKGAREVRQLSNEIVELCIVRNMKYRIAGPALIHALCHVAIRSQIPTSELLIMVEETHTVLEHLKAGEKPAGLK